MVNTSLLTNKFMKRNIGPTEDELLMSSDEEEEEVEDQKASTEDLRGSMIKKNKKKPGKNKEDIRATLEKKEEE